MENVGLVVIGHGSKLPHGRENLEKLANILRKQSVFNVVKIAFMVRNNPTIPEAIDELASQGIKKIVLIPAFLAQGVHTTKEIPELIGMKDKESQLSDRGIQLVYGEPIGADERIAEILEEKALKALGKKIEDISVNSPYGTNTPKASNQIFETSMNLIRPQIQETLSKAPSKHVSIIERLVHTTANPEFADLLEINEHAIDAGVDSIIKGAKIVADVKMVKAGINEKRLKEFNTKIQTYIDDPRVIKMAHEESITRSTAAMRLAAKDGLDGAIILIGNAPTAAFELARLVEQEGIKPALIIATPVGYVGAAESKEAIAKLPIPYIIIKGRKGGSPPAVSIFNALLAMAEKNELTGQKGA